MFDAWQPLPETALVSFKSSRKILGKVLDLHLCLWNGQSTKPLINLCLYITETQYFHFPLRSLLRVHVCAWAAIIEDALLQGNDLCVRVCVLIKVWFISDVSWLSGRSSCLNYPINTAACTDHERPRREREICYEGGKEWRRCIRKRSRKSFKYFLLFYPARRKQLPLQQFFNILRPTTLLEWETNLLRFF